MVQMFIMCLPAMACAAAGTAATCLGGSGGWQTCPPITPPAPSSTLCCSTGALHTQPAVPACQPACLCCGALLWFGLSAVGALTPTAVCLGCLACRLTEKEGADGMMRGAVRCVRQPAAVVPAA